MSPSYLGISSGSFTWAECWLIFFYLFLEKLNSYLSQCRGVTSLLWNDIELSWKLHLPEHLLRIFTYKNENVVIFN